MLGHVRRPSNCVFGSYIQTPELSVQTAKLPPVGHASGQSSCLLDRATRHSNCLLGHATRQSHYAACWVMQPDQSNCILSHEARSSQNACWAVQPERSNCQLGHATRPANCLLVHTTSQSTLLCSSIIPVLLVPTYIYTLTLYRIIFSPQASDIHPSVITRPHLHPSPILFIIQYCPIPIFSSLLPSYPSPSLHTLIPFLFQSSPITFFL